MVDALFHGLSCERLSELVSVLAVEVREAPLGLGDIESPNRTGGGGGAGGTAAIL